MTYVVLQPKSLTNPSDKHRIVRFSDWTNYSDGRRRALPVVAECDTYEQARARKDELNASGA